jgi:hypothetical protein
MGLSYLRRSPESGRPELLGYVFERKKKAAIEGRDTRFVMTMWKNEEFAFKAMAFLGGGWNAEGFTGQDSSDVHYWESRTTTEKMWTVIERISPYVKELDLYIHDNAFHNI